MTINTTRYSPDTCGCVIEYSWDDSVLAEQRQHTLSTIVEKCPAHEALSNSGIFSTILDENPRKNNALTTALENGPTALYDIVDGTRQLKQNISYNFSWSGTAPDRVLSISFSGISLTANQKNALQTFLNNKFGVGKVLIA